MANATKELVVGTTPKGSISFSIVPFNTTSEFFAITESGFPTIVIKVI